MRPDLRHFSRPPRPPVLGDIAQQLRDLPAEISPPYDFAEFRRRSSERSAPRRQMVTWWPHAAAAASLTIFVGAMAMLGTGKGTHSSGAAHGPSTATIATVSGTDSAQIGGSDAAASSSPDVSRDPAEQARAAREWLAHQPTEPAVVRAGPRLLVANLEDRIAWFDDTLTDERLRGASADQLKLLQQERARLVASLAQVRYAEALAATGT